MTRHGFALIPAGALLALSLAACSNDTGPSQSSSILSIAEADSLGEVVAQDADEMVSASDFNSVTGVTLVTPIGAPPHLLHGPPPCNPVVTPNPPTNSDADAVPDSARLDFTGCTFSRGNFDFTVSGLIDVIDPSPTVAEFAVRLVFTDFGRTWTNTQTNRTWSAVHNGSRQVSANADTLGHIINNFITNYTFPDGATATHVRNWVGRFEADVPGSIAVDIPLPAGNWTFAGSSTWSKGARNWSAQTSTTTALHYDPSCTVAPRFTAGELFLTVTRHSHIVNVTIDFTGCGQYTVTRTVP
jgi:hypothetical protein